MAAAGSMLAAAAVIAGATGVGSLGWSEPWAMLTIQGPGALAGAMLRIGVLVAVLVATKSWKWHAAVVVTFGASVVASGLTVLHVAVGGIATLLGRDASPRSLSGFVLAVLLAAGACAVALLGIGAPPRALTPPERLDERVAYYADRGNLFQARAAALAWCQGEYPPGIGCVLTANLDHEMGLDGEARIIAEQVVVQSAEAMPKREAKTLLDALAGGGE